MKKFIISLIIIIAGLFLVDRMGGEIMWLINQDTQDEIGPKLKYLANYASEDLIILGTSRCAYHYVPSIIGDTLGVSVYNGGIDATENIYSHYFILNQIFTHHIPKVVCLEITGVRTTQDPFRPMSFFAPYIGRSEEADSLFRDAGTYYLYKFSHLYRYNAKAVSNIAGLFINKHMRDDAGYSPLSRPVEFPKELKPREQEFFDIDSLKVKYTIKFIDKCRRNNVQLILVNSPAFWFTSPSSESDIQRLANEYGVPFIDYNLNGLFHDHPELFRDNAHLWDEGARAFSSLFAHDLKLLMKELNK